MAKQNMASASDSDEKSSSSAESDLNNDLDSDEYSDVESDSQTKTVKTVACRFYNSGGCRDGNKCLYQHVCKYALKGNCRYGSKCKLSHSTDGGPSSGARSRRSSRPTSRDDEDPKDPVLSSGQFYQWQLKAKQTWEDVENDHVIEAQYSLPHTKGIKIYNTPYGKVNIDFNKMRVNGKNMRVRRLDDGKTKWIWYFSLCGKWNKYGDKVPGGKCSPVTSRDIEQIFKTDRKGSVQFSINGKPLEIRFADMKQVGEKKDRKVNRRPLYRPKQPATGVFQAAAALQNLNLGHVPRWQVERNRGGWSDFKQNSSATDCSITTEDIERKYQQNPNDVVFFTVKGEQYKLDFKEMKQTNVTTKKSRRIRRI